MKISRPMSVLAFFIATALIAQDAKVTPLMSKDLAEFPGKEGLMIMVVYPPGASDPIHRHNASSAGPAGRWSLRPAAYWVLQAKLAASSVLPLPL